MGLWSQLLRRLRQEDHLNLFEASLGNTVSLCLTKNLNVNFKIWQTDMQPRKGHLVV